MRNSMPKLLPGLLLACALTSVSWTVAAQNPQVKFQTSAGDFTVELYADKAPKTVENFLQYVKDKHYNGTIFHRVIPNFMVQGGGYDTKYAEKPTRAPVPHEGREALGRGGPRNTIGTLAMARTNDPQSATAQFFINVQDNAFLDPVLIPPGDPVPRFEYQGEVYLNKPRAALLNSPLLFGYTVFGKVISGMDVITKIKSTPTGAGGPFPRDVPKTPITINSATVAK
jgi:peptidyl-prolyl cis-trans isomerase A (cyclophilin A)